MDIMNFKAQAILNLRPGALWTMHDMVVEWLDTSQTEPSEDEINLEIAKLQQEYQATEYQRQRKEEYPKIEEQLDLLWHAIDSGNLDKTSNFYLQLKQVKEKYPKG